MLETFPTEAPFRINQVMASPLLMGFLFAVQLALAAAATVAIRRRSQFGWWLAICSLLGLTALFFSLASWGTSDIAKLNFYFDPVRETGPPLQALLPFEPFWWSLAPLIIQLPYRMAAVHGLIVAGFGAVPVLLSRSWNLQVWAGWWLLLLCTSPILRGFFQNSHSRQAFATLLAVPLFLWGIGVVRGKALWVMGSALLSTGVHLTALPTLVLAGLPALRLVQWQRLARRKTCWLLVSVLALILVVLLSPLLTKLNAYGGGGFFSSYPIKTDVLRVQFLLVGTVAVVCLKQRHSWRQFLDEEEGCCLLLYLGCYVTIQASLFLRFFPQISFRLGDTVGIFLLLSFLAWLRRRQALFMVLPLLVFSLLAWGDRVVWPEGLNCGSDDDFLCIPDRWPWSIDYVIR